MTKPTTGCARCWPRRSTPGCGRPSGCCRPTSTAAVDLSGCDALSRALDVRRRASRLRCRGRAAADRADRRRVPPLLHRDGRPTGEWAAAVARLAAADEEVARCAEAVDEVDEGVSRHAELSGWLGELGTQRKSAHERLTAARAAAAAVAELTAELREAEVMSAAAQATADASAAALTERRRQIGDVDERVGAVAGLEAAAVEAAEHESVAAEVCDVAAAAAEQSSAMVEDAQACADAARATVDRLSDREEATRLTARLAKIDSARAELQRAENEITANTITDAVLQMSRWRPPRWKRHRGSPNSPARESNSPRPPTWRCWLGAARSGCRRSRP